MLKMEQKFAKKNGEQFSIRVSVILSSASIGARGPGVGEGVSIGQIAKSSRES